MRRILYILLLFIWPGIGKVDSFAQEKVTVITRKVEKEFVLEKNPRIFINSERGMISIKSWDRSDMKVTLKLIAKNVDADLAREELNQMKYALAETRNSIFLSNRMQLSNSGNSISSVIRAEYEIFVPRNIEIHLDNRFGNVRIENTNGGLYGELYYSDINLNGYSGDIDLHVMTGDFVCVRSKLSGRMDTKHSNIFISDVEGVLSMKTQYGSLHLRYGENLLQFNLNSNATHVLIDNRINQYLSLQIKGSYCLMRLNESSYAIKKEWLENTYKNDPDQKLWYYNYEPEDSPTYLRLDLTFGTLNLM